MKKQQFKYSNNDQFINDACKIILQEWLQWSDSLEHKPSTYVKKLREFFIDAYISANIDLYYSFLTEAEVTDYERHQIYVNDFIEPLLKQASKQADAKSVIIKEMCE